MKSITLSEQIVSKVRPESLVGTKWIAWSEFFGDNMAVEFVDESNCIYTARAKKYPITYAVSEGRIFISYIKDPFELRGKVLFNNNVPAFEMQA